MKSHFCCNDMISVGSIFLYSVFSCHLDHGFIRFCSGVLEKYLIHSYSGTYLFCQKCLWNGIRIIKCMHKSFCLLNNSFHYLLITVSCRINCYTCIKIKICFSFFIIYILVFCTFRQKIKSLIGLNHIFRDFVLNVLCSKSYFLQFHNYHSPFHSIIIFTA